jgi:3-dehydroquinate dehydratase
LESVSRYEEETKEFRDLERKKFEKFKKLLKVETMHDVELEKKKKDQRVVDIESSNIV